MTASNDNDGDILLGVPAIAKHLGVTQRQVRNLVYDRDDLPTFKLGGLVAARKSTLAKYFAKLEKTAA